MSGAPLPPGSQGFADGSRRRLLRRALPLLALGGAALLYFAFSPAETTLSYDLGARREGLCSLQVDLFKLPGRELARHTQYLYSEAAPAPAIQVQSLRLSRGEYEADFTLGECTGQHREAKVRFRFEGQEWISLPVTGP
jgi:hypothetical protein